MNTLELRPYQGDSVESLRCGFRENHYRQVLAAPTGAGKSRIMEFMIRSAMDKGSRIMFICERRILVEQFSAHLDRAGIDHGILMAGHWRFRPGKLVQIASAQTLERMESLPAVDIVFIDELHACLRASIIRMIESRPTMRIVGATATPFHPAIGKYFTKVVSVTSMAKLVDDKFLVPFRVFVAKEIDTTDLKIVAGEWKKDDLEKRGQQIVGDVVADYIRISHEVFGGYRKTICFSCGIAHGAELAQRFNEAGVNAVQISSEDNEEYRDEVLKDFAKPDSAIKVVISVAILSRGFDQSDVDYVILARPLKKSFSEHVQMLGRGARIHPGKEFCIARDSLVLTDTGLVKIQDVSLDNKVWDGVNFVSHQGAICRGVKPVIQYDGVTATPEHEVMTHDGWQRLEEAARRRIGIARTGNGRNPIRLSDNLFTSYTRQGGGVQSGGALQQVWKDSFRALLQYQPTSRNTGMPTLQSAPGSGSAGMDLQAVSSAAAAVRKPLTRLIRAIRDAWNSVQISLSSRCCELGYEGARASTITVVPIGSNGQRWPLRAWKPSVGQSSTQHEQHASFRKSSTIFGVQGRESRGSLCGHNPETDASFGHDDGANSAAMGCPVMQAEREVWDVLNAGPLQRFTVDGRLVHNCVIQDNSGNFLRFKDDWDALYHDGVQELGQGQDSKPKKEPTKEQKDASKCPKCSVVWAGGDTCLNCGHVRVKRNEVVAVAGEMVEISASKRKADKHTPEQKVDFYAQLLGYAQNRGYRPGWAFYKYEEKFGVRPSMKTPAPIAPGAALKSWVVSQNIRKARSGAK